MRVRPLLLVLAVLASSLAAQSAPLTFSPKRLRLIDSAMRGYVDQGQIAGAVTLVLRNGRVAHQGVYGWADKAAGKRLAADAIFRIASQTKAITSVAVMILVEEGKLGLGDPVSRWLPSFASSKVATRSDTGLVIVPARRPITIRDLLTHTAGISYGTNAHVASLYQAKGLGPAAGFGWYTADKDEPICETMDRLGTLPFVSQPGEAFVYGYNTDILGCVVERVSGLPLDRFFAERITGPLGMRDTHFFLPEDKRDRLAVVHRVDEAGQLARSADGARGQGHYVDGPRKSFAGGAGLVSTARDYARFLEMLRNGGELEGVRLLSPTTVRLMTVNQVGTLFGTEGAGFSLGFSVAERPGAGGSPESVGTFGWGGAYQTDYSVDPAQGLVVVLMTQHLPGTPLNVGSRFTSLVYQALVPAAAAR
ncbi:MAG: serine hydrolase domain-containing protein [Gemmatimonadales bacterium]